ncbi:hypothetical protein GW17_00047360 [Ensete ventricosum]|nr:hypothetical protein GW17_00047360 [Ensete ventricosum]
MKSTTISDVRFVDDDRPPFRWCFQVGLHGCPFLPQGTRRCKDLIPNATSTTHDLHMSTSFTLPLLPIHLHLLLPPLLSSMFPLVELVSLGSDVSTSCSGIGISSDDGAKLVAAPTFPCSLMQSLITTSRGTSENLITALRQLCRSSVRGCPQGLTFSVSMHELTGEETATGADR